MRVHPAPQQKPPQRDSPLQTGYFWEIIGTDSGGAPASGFTLDLTLPYATADSLDKVCRYTGPAWDCAASSSTATSVTRTGVTAFSFWAVADNAGPTALTLQAFGASSGGTPVAMRALLGLMVLALGGALVWRRRRARTR